MYPNKESFGPKRQETKKDKEKNALRSKELGKLIEEIKAASDTAANLSNQFARTS